MKQTHHHFLITFAVSVTVFVGALLIYMGYSIRQMTATAAEARSTALDLEKESALGSKLRGDVSNSKDSWTRLSEAFVPNDEAVRFIETLESTGKNVGSTVSISSIDNADPSEGSLATNGYIHAKVNVQGRWSATMKTLMLIENLPYMATMSDVELTQSPKKDEKSPLEWSATFEINVAKSI